VYCLGSGIFLQQVEVEVEESGRRRHADRGGPGRIVRTAERRERKPWAHMEMGRGQKSEQRFLMFLCATEIDYPRHGG
jgi:hypothetical protein